MAQPCMLSFLKHHLGMSTVPQCLAPNVRRVTSLRLQLLHERLSVRQTLLAVGLHDMDDDFVDIPRHIPSIPERTDKYCKVSHSEKHWEGISPIPANVNVAALVQVGPHFFSVLPQHVLDVNFVR